MKNHHGPTLPMTIAAVAVGGALLALAVTVAVTFDTTPARKLRKAIAFVTFECVDWTPHHDITPPPAFGHDERSTS